MNDRRPPEIDMNLEGEFVSPPRPPVMTKILLWAIVIAIIAGAFALAAFALWLALMILPIAFGAALIAWGVFRFQVWRAGKSLSGQRDLRRP